jgi:hypothetical protein
MLTVVRYITIMLCALALSLGLTQAWVTSPAPAMLTAVAALLSAAAVSALILSILLRKRPGFGLAVWGTFVLAISGVLWAFLMLPGRQPQWMLAMVAAIPAPTGAEVRQLLHDRNAVLFALSAWLVGFSLVVLSAIRQPVMRRANRGRLPLFGRIIS